MRIARIPGTYSDQRQLACEYPSCAVPFTKQKTRRPEPPAWDQLEGKKMRCDLVKLLVLELKNYEVSGVIRRDIIVTMPCFIAKWVSCAAVCLFFTAKDAFDGVHENHLGMR
jgi:hypothetical protein